MMCLWSLKYWPSITEISSKINWLVEKFTDCFFTSQFIRRRRLGLGLHSANLDSGWENAAVCSSKMGRRWLISVCVAAFFALSVCWFGYSFSWLALHLAFRRPEPRAGPGVVRERKEGGAGEEFASLAQTLGERGDLIRISWKLKARSQVLVIIGRRG